MKKKIKYILSYSPQNIDDDSWYYEYRGKITFVKWATDGHGNRYCTTTHIPWRMLMNSARRCRPEEFRFDEVSIATPPKREFRMIKVKFVKGGKRKPQIDDTSYMPYS